MLRPNGLGRGSRSRAWCSGVRLFRPMAAILAVACGGHGSAASTGSTGAASGNAASGAGSGATSGTGSNSSPDAGALAPSCAPGGPGMTNCGATHENCCTSLEVTGGTYYRTYDAVFDAGVYAGAVLAADGGPTGEGDPAMVSTFRLDKYEVTLGRYRQFVNAWAAGWLPAAGSGKHSHLNGGLGLASSAGAGTYETGWVSADNSNVSPTNANLNCAATLSNWTPSVGIDENLPINCVNSYEALAFCIWDGGFLPSEAEWGHAAGGGSQQREYPWGSIDPGTGYQYSIYDCHYPSGSGPCTSVASVVPAPVGTATLGAGLWSQLDLAGSVAEWNLDWFSDYVNPCVDCAYLAPDPGRVFRGGDLASSASDLLVPHRLPLNPAARTYYLGFRCARSAP